MVGRVSTQGEPFAMHERRWMGHAMIIFTQIVLGINIPVTRDLLVNFLSPLGYMALRALPAAAIFWLLQLASKREPVAKRDLALILLGGFLGFVFSQYLTAQSLRYTSPVYFSLILALSPVIVLLFQALFFGEKITARKVFGISLGIAGAAILAVRGGLEGGSQGADNLIGIGLALVSVSAFAAYVVICGDISRKYRPVTQMKWVFSLSAALVCPLWGLSGGWAAEPLFSGLSAGWAELAFIVLLCTVGVYILIPIGMRTVSASVVSIYMNLQPIVASAAAIAVGMDAFSWDKPAALILVLAGAWIVTTDRCGSGEAVDFQDSRTKAAEGAPKSGPEEVRPSGGSPLQRAGGRPGALAQSVHRERLRVGVEKRLALVGDGSARHEVVESLDGAVHDRRSEAAHAADETLRKDVVHRVVEGLFGKKRRDARLVVLDRHFAHGEGGRVLRDAEKELDVADPAEIRAGRARIHGRWPERIKNGHDAAS